MSKTGTGAGGDAPNTPAAIDQQDAHQQDDSPKRSLGLFVHRAGLYGIVGAFLVFVLIVVALFAPLIAPYDPYTQDPGNELDEPSRAHLAGTDEFGRDVLSRTIYGSRFSLAIAFAGVTSAMVIGGVLGLVAGVAGGVTDTVIMRFTDFLLAFPGILLGILVVTILGPGTMNLAVAIAVASVPIFIRIMRARVYGEIELEYVDAARAIGCSKFRLTFRHLLPNCLSVLVVQANITMVNAILLEAGLSFIGLGAQAPEPSWGLMLRMARGYLRQAPVYALAPGIALSLLMIGVNFTADSLRNLLDPRRN